MAEGIIFPLVTEVLKILASAAGQEIGSIFVVHKELEKLQRNFSAIKAVLLDAEQREDHDHAVKNWIGELKDAAYDVDDLLDSFSYESTRRKVISEGKRAKKVRIFFSKFNLINFRRKMAGDIKNLVERLDLIADQRNKYQFQEIVDNQSKNGGRETHSFVHEEEVIGRDEEKEEVVKRLLEINEKQNVSVDAIVGLGGLGKTMLAQSVFNLEKVKDAFDLRLWVCIDQPFDLKIILEKIIESATSQRPLELQMDSLQSKLRNLIDGKKYLLVMDDVWNENGEKWTGLKRLLMGGAKGSKILITTRSKLVAEVSQATSPYVLEGLSESNSWILLQKMAFKECDEPESQNLTNIGIEIAKKCMGVPLVIRIIGRLLYFKTSEAEWLSFKNNDFSTVTQQENEITQVLKVTYNHLPSHLKPCFAYCSLFPKDHQYHKDEMIKLWVAEGFIQSQDENKYIEDVGNEYFMELIWRSVFQEVKRNIHGEVEGCKMHDFMHDLAKLVAGTECFTPNSDDHNIKEQTRRVLLNRGSNWSILSTSQLKPYKLRTFLSLSSTKLNEAGLKAHISSLKLLRVLNLRFLNIRQVPFSIGMLKHLRYLNLLDCTEMKSLPNSIAKLYNLQTLNLRGCSLKKLPRDIGSLFNLRHLDTSFNAGIERLPGSISKLHKLQTLNLMRCSLKELPIDIGSITDLRHLNISNNYYLKLLPSSITKLHFLQSLNLSGCFMIELSRDIGSLTNLRHLDISNNYAIELLPSSVTKLQFLQILNLNKCKKLKELPENIGNMLDLRFLHLEGNECIELLPNSIVKLQKLQLLNLKGCLYLREMPRDVCNLVNLKHLDLENCVGLMGMPLGLNKITALQTLNLYAVGSSMSCEYGGLCQLNMLINIKGRLHIRGLHHLRNDTSQANNVNLKEHHGVRDFSLEWSDFGNNPNAIDSDLVVMEKLRPDKNVETLNINGYGGVRLCSWVSSHLNLTKISIVNCVRLQYVPRLDGLPNLKTLRLEILNCIEYIDKNETMDESHSYEFFPSLKSLTIWNVSRLKGWREFTPKDHCQSFLPPFPCLSDLNIRDCPQLISIPWPHSSLTRLVLDNSSAETLKRELAVSASHYSVLSKLEFLQLWGIGGIQLPEEVFLSLQHLEERNCPNLCLSRSQCEEDEAEDDTQREAVAGLYGVRLESCPKLVSLPEGLQYSTTLRTLEILSCKDLLMLPDWIGNLTSLRTLKIMACPRVASLPEGIHQLSTLRHLIISGCPQLQERCRVQSGEDWPKVAHVMWLSIDG